MDFKTAVLNDLQTFNNPGEFATMTNIWYCGKQYEVPAIIDHTAAEDRQKLENDHGEGIDKAEAVLYISQADMGFVPKKGRQIEVEEAGAVTIYEITKSKLEHGEIILELGAYVE